MTFLANMVQFDRSDCEWTSIRSSISLVVAVSNQDRQTAPSLCHIVQTDCSISMSHSTDRLLHLYVT